MKNKVLKYKIMYNSSNAIGSHNCTISKGKHELVSLKKGMLVCFDSENENFVKICTKDSIPIGIVLLDCTSKDEENVTIQLLTNSCNTANVILQESIAAGDLLTIGDDGFVKKHSGVDVLIGMALSSGSKDNLIEAQTTLAILPKA